MCVYVCKPVLVAGNWINTAASCVTNAAATWQCALLTLEIGNGKVISHLHAKWQENTIKLLWRNSFAASVTGVL